MAQSMPQSEDVSCPLPQASHLCHPCYILHPKGTRHHLHIYLTVSLGLLVIAAALTTGIHS